MSNEIVWKKVVTPNNDFLCKKCRSANLVYHEKESFCGGYDYFCYKCEDCNHQWKSEGIDS